MRRTIIVFGLFSLLAFNSPCLLAWNNTGHKTVALLAYRSLPEGKKATLIKILENHPHLKLHLLDGAPDDPEKRNEWIVMQAATWPDWVRPGNSDPRITEKYHISDRHFFDIPFVLPEYEGRFKTVIIPPKDHDAVKDLRELVNDLKTKGKADEDTAVNLCWILHVTGDIHQPLHCSTMYSSQFPAPEGDHGGNYFVVRVGESGVKLHAFWDDLLGSNEKYTDIDHLAVQLTKEYKKEDFKDLLKVVDIMEWAKESHELAETKAYRDTNGSLLKGTFSKEKSVSHVKADPLPDGYRQAALLVAKKQVTLAGFRLCDLLEGNLP